MKRIAAITMARNDEFFLNRWVKYYGRQFGEENLYIYLDGLDQQVPSGAGCANVSIVEKKGYYVVDAEKQRLAYLSDRAAELLQHYDLIIGCDADEFLVLDPKLNKTLAEYLSEIKVPVTLSGLGLDFGQHLTYEKSLDTTKLFLQQREFALISTRYTKTTVISKAVRWGSGFHRVRRHNYKIDKNLYLFHFGNANYEALKSRFSDQDFIKTGRIRHLKKRLKVIEYVSNNRILDGDKIFGIVRKIQSFFRPIYSWNKPSMLGLKIVVKIPERFKNIG
ncbi:MAG: glycosyltransferase family 2 protein, partial [Bacteroidales bacterium]|nr:glycosyltransferase family 2 protein [Bacteroidales bacterium]